MSASSSNFRINRDTFDLFHLILQKRLKPGRLTVADSTALYPFARTPLLEMAKLAQFHTCLLVFQVPFAICKHRDGQRAVAWCLLTWRPLLGSDPRVGGRRERWEATGRTAAHALYTDRRVWSLCQSPVIPLLSYRGLAGLPLRMFIALILLGEPVQRGNDEREKARLFAIHTIQLERSTIFHVNTTETIRTEITANRWLTCQAGTPVSCSQEATS